MAMQSDKEYLPKAQCHFLRICPFRLFSNDNKAALKILLFSTSERCYYYFRRDLLFQMTCLRGGQLAARGPHVARHRVFSGPRKHSGKTIKSEISTNLPQ